MNMDFIIVWLIMAVSVGGFCALMIMATLDIKSTWANILISIFIAALSSFLVTCMMFHEQKQNQILWNDGYCTCGTEWRLVNVQRYRGQTLYFYTCDNCGRTIEIE